MLREKWMEYLKSGRWQTYQGSLKPVADFNSELTLFLERMTKQVYKEANQGLKESDVIENMRHQINRSELSQIKTSYVVMYNTYHELADERKQEAWADMKERLRFLIFRILTAIGIAAVVMATYYLAGEWNIQLPMTRSILPAP